MPFDIEKARENFHKRESERRRRLGRLEESAKADLARIVAMLVDRYKPKRIHPLHAETIRKEGRLIYERK